VIATAMAPWERALRHVTTTLDGAGAPWLIVGSVASVLQGCEMTPRDLDILFTSRDDLARYAARAASLALDIREERFPGGFEWHKAHHQVDGFTVDAVYIASGGGIPDAPDGAGVWEGGPHTWDLAGEARFGEFTVLVAPLEVQLESQLRRGCEDRAQAILAVLTRRGVDAAMLRHCLAREHYADVSASLGLDGA